MVSFLDRCAKDILPDLTKKYPNLEMQAELHTTSPPKATFSHDGIRVAGPGQVVVSVLPHGGAPVPVFALNIDLTTSAKVHHRACACACACDVVHSRT